MATPLLLIFFSLIFSNVIGQVNPNKDRQIVLRHNKLGKEYIFDRSKIGDYNRTEITYLGKVKTQDGRVFKILISEWYWGLNRRATYRIVVFNGKNQYLGNYYCDNLPSKIENNVLVFENKNRDDCDPSVITRVNFNNGLPKQFFIKCKNNMGHIYSFGDE
jgi:hypothetical protein